MSTHPAHGERVPFRLLGVSDVNIGLAFALMAAAAAAAVRDRRRADEPGRGNQGVRTAIALVSARAAPARR